jgi:predicted  nucleic acid-binding Zn-ribbon protein
MDVPDHPDGRTTYTTPARVQAWFLGKSRARWKRKYQALKADAKRLQNRVNDVTKSRQQWREKARELEQRVRGLEAELAARHQPALKKGGPAAGRSGGR